MDYHVYKNEPSGKSLVGVPVGILVGFEEEGVELEGTEVGFEEEGKELEGNEVGNEEGFEVEGVELEGTVVGFDVGKTVGAGIGV